MKKVFILSLLSIFLCANKVYSDSLDALNAVSGASIGVSTVNSIIMTKSIVENNKSLTRKLDAETEDIKKNGRSIKIIPQADGTAKVYLNGVEMNSDADPNSPEYKLGLSMAQSWADRIEKNNAKRKIKEIKDVAKIENNTEILEIIKKYKKAGAVVTLQKINEFKEMKAL